MKRAATSLILLLATASAARAATVYVDAAAVGPEDGSETHPFNTVEEGVAAANAGDTVLLAAGAYTPATTLQLNEAIALQGAGKAATQVNAGVDLTAPDGPLAMVLADLTVGDVLVPYVEDGTTPEVRIQRAGLGSAVFERVPTKPILLEDCEASGDLRFWFGAYGVLANAVRRCAVGGEVVFSHGALAAGTNAVEDAHVSGDVRFVHGAVEPKALEDAVRRCTVDGAIEFAAGAGGEQIATDDTVGAGIVDRSGATWTLIARNRILSGGIEDASGTPEEGAETEIIEDNVIEDGFASLRGASVTFRRNVVRTTAADQSAIDAASGGPANIVGNLVELPYDATAGFDPPCALRNISGPGDIRDNVLVGGACGIRDSTGAAAVIGNSISGAHYGVVTSGLGDYVGNVVTNCVADGLVFQSSDPHRIERNRIENNGGAGIRVRRPADLGGGALGSVGENALRGNAGGDLVVDAMLDPAAEISALWNLWDHAEPTDIAALDVVDERPAPTGGVLLEPYAPESLLYLVVHDRAPTKDAGDALGLLLIRAGFP